MNKFLKIFSAVFLGVGIIFLIIGLAWLYSFYNEPDLNAPDDEWIGPLIFTFMGLLFSTIGAGIFFYQAKQKAKRELLKRTGRKLRGIIAKTYYNTSITYRVGNQVQHPMIVECEAELSGKKQTFKSESVWGEAPFYVGKEITIYVDTRDYSNYWVDTGEQE
jgi:hypothetical protein